MKRKPEKGRELLLRMGGEESPAQCVSPSLAELKERATQLLKAARLHHGTIKTLGTPRRLTLWVQNLADHQASVSREVMGPSKAVGFDAQGQPTKAAIGFAGSQGVPVTSLEGRPTPRGDYLFAGTKEAGRMTTMLMPGFLTEILGGR